MQQSTPENTDEEAWIQMMRSVIKGVDCFYMEESLSYVNIHEIVKVVYQEFDVPLTPVQFAVVDMDQDGRSEIIVELTNNFDGWIIVLRYYEGNVYGYGFVYRGLKSLSTTGLAISSSGASDSNVFRLRFNGHEMHQEILSATAETYAFSNWEDASWYMYSSENIDKFVTDQSMISEPVVSPIPAETQAIVYDQAVFIEGYVAGGTGGLNIRNGPGTSFSQVGRLAEYEAVIVDQTQWSDNREWGHINEGWVCMDYIILSTPPDVRDAYLVGYIIGSLDGVNVRSGPAIEYDQVGKLPLGKQVIVTKLCNNGISEWGYIGNGWICTDYINFGEPGPGTDFPY